MLNILILLKMYASVIVDIVNSEVDKIFEYSLNGLNVELGSRVSVPFGYKNIEGIVIGLSERAVFPIEKIKPITAILDDEPVLTKEGVKLAKYIQKKYFVPLALSLRLFLPTELRRGQVKAKVEKFCKLSNKPFEEMISEIKANASNQKGILERLCQTELVKQSLLANDFGISSVNALLKKGFIEVVEVQGYREPYKELNEQKKEIVLTEKQEEAINAVLSTDKMVTLLHGVTGSGKTEVYLELISRAIASGKTAIMLVPEISLTPQMLRQLRARFKDIAAILHSGLSKGERFDEWWRLKTGKAKIAIGARSAIFAPLENVGIIIVDEEHDSSYLSESSPRYSTIDLAKFRAKENNAKIVLGSATPSVDSYLLAKNGEYNLIELPERINKQPLPEIITVDMRTEVRRGNNTPFSYALREEIKNALDKQNQVIIFLNQRGYSKNVICTECGEPIKCKDCDVSLTYHMENESLLCHYCGAKYKMVKACPNCGSKYIRYGGFGTQRVVMELQNLFPNAKILRMDRDSTQNKEGHVKILESFAKREADILVGTQMIAKGHDFPLVTLVGILDADMSLHFSDFRSNERTFQLITQVAGRSGRAKEKGKVVVQTYSPDNFVLKKALAYDYKGLFEREISLRKATGFPPFSDIVRILITTKDEEKTAEVTKELYSKLKTIYESKKEEFSFFGCMKAPLKKLQGKFRYQILMRINKNNQDLLDKIYEISLKYGDRNVGVFVEENPTNLT
ncbi:MAG: primosomal protein N' [Clostridiales bacterium]|nr:primosomal protein N' [Clostridiales bacterium]